MAVAAQQKLAAGDVGAVCQAQGDAIRAEFIAFDAAVLEQAGAMAFSHACQAMDQLQRVQMAAAGVEQAAVIDIRTEFRGDVSAIEQA